MTMTKPSYVYVTYIETTAERVWRAIVDPDVTRTYWMGPNAGVPAHVNVSDWRPGSPWEHQRADDTRAVDIAGTVIESTPPTRLVISWARPAELADTSKHSRVTFEIDSIGDALVRLTVTHEGLEHDEKMLNGISSGWPMVLSNLKTLLEKGKALPRVKMEAAAAKG
jgi:uncharacterized protein YndB with AHSA1/START domain